MNIFMKGLLLLLHINHSDAENEKPVLATVTKRDEGGYRLWPSCNAPSSFVNFWSILPVASGKKVTDARCYIEASTFYRGSLEYNCID